MTRVLTNQDSTITLTAYSDGTQTDQGTFTIGIVDGNGDTVVAAGTAVTDNSDGTYEYVLTAQTNPDILTATWTESGGQPVYTTTIEVVGSQLFNEAQARAFQISGSQTPLSSTSAYTDATIAEAQDRITDQFERETGRSWIRRYARLETSGTGSRALDPIGGRYVTSTGRQAGGPGRRNDIGTILSCTIGGTAVTAANIKIVDGVFYRTDGTFTRASSTNPNNVVIEYTYGVDPVDLEAQQAGLRMLVADLVPSDVPGWATSWTNEDGTFNRTDSGFAYPTKVYQWLKRNNAYSPVI